MARKAIKWILILLIIALFIVLALFGLRYYMYARYPLKYENLIRTYATEYGLDPYFVASVIWAESGYDKDAVSRSDARGLMQIMPDTGSWIADKLGESGYTEDALFTPEVSIRYGCWYLSYLTDKFEGNELKILAGYNAGPGRVDEWQQSWGEGHLPTAEDIPFEETKNYVTKIAKAKDIYKKLYTI